MATKTNQIWVQEGDTRRQLEGEELSNFLESAAEIEAEVKEREDLAEARATQKAALLNRLGITDDEAKLLLA